MHRRAAHYRGGACIAYRAQPRRRVHRRAAQGGAGICGRRATC